MAKNIVSILVLSLVLAACGSSAEPVSMNETGTIEDGDSDHEGRKCDTYDFNVGEGFNVDVRMTSEYDNIVYLTNGSEQIAMNDDGDDLNAHLTHTVAAGQDGAVTLHACAYGDDGRGAYTLAIRTTNGG